MAQVGGEEGGVIAHARRRRAAGRQEDRARAERRSASVASIERAPAHAVKLLLVAVGQREPAWADTAYDDYAKRFPPELRLELKAGQGRAARRQDGCAADGRRGERIEAALPRGARRVALDERGERVTRSALAARLRAWQRRGPRRRACSSAAPTASIPRCKASADETLRLSDLTLPHAFVRVLLAEALYRAWSVNGTTRTTANDAADPRASGPGFVYLASQSPRRRQLLDQIGVRHELLLAGADEDAEALEASATGESPAAYVERVTRAKLRAARAAPAARAALPARRSSAPTRRSRSAARILGKPRDAADAARCWRCCRAAPTACITAVAVARAAHAGSRSASRACASRRSPRPRIERLRRQRRAVRQGRRVRDPERRRRPGSSASRAATPVSWVCRCTRRRAARSGRASTCTAEPDSASSPLPIRCKTS